MKLSDRASSFLFFIAAILLWVAASALPNPGQQIYGPDFYPKSLAVMIGIASLVLFIKSIKEEKGLRLCQISSWVKDGYAVFCFLLIVATVLSYYFFVEWLGFIVATALLMFIIFQGLRVRIVKSLILTVGTTLLVYVLFDMILRVPLPRGSLFFG